MTNLPGNPQVLSPALPHHPGPSKAPLSWFYPPQTPSLTASGKSTDPRCQFLFNYKQIQGPRQLPQPRPSSCSDRFETLHKPGKETPCQVKDTPQKLFSPLKIPTLLCLICPCNHRDVLPPVSFPNSNSPAFLPH